MNSKPRSWETGQPHPCRCLVLARLARVPDVGDGLQMTENSQPRTIWPTVRRLIAGLLVAHVVAYGAALLFFGPSPNNTFLLRRMHWCAICVEMSCVASQGPKCPCGSCALAWSSCRPISTLRETGQYGVIT